MQLGYIGLGKMGHNMVERLIEKGYSVVVFNRSPEPVQKAVAIGAVGTDSLSALVEKLPAPRVIWIMVSWQAVDAVLAELVPLLSPGDLVIDGGNSPYTETIRRAKEISDKGIMFLDAGVSGGPSGARNGACVMVGGDGVVFKKHEQLFKDISLPNGYMHVGAAGAGHFVKMVHNGIEYGMMQAIGEGFEILARSDFSLDLSGIAQLYNVGSVIESRLVGWLASAYNRRGKQLDGVSGEVSHSGEGEWTVETARRMNIPVPVIGASLQFRKDSKGNSTYTGKVVSALRNEFGGHDVTEK